ncbi:hypothetical protein PSH85_15995 [Pseudomonas simiae]|uniref:hypothetical protein n=1 Tax=Pseudomonas simiae TaxID=321846 RepID=UPI000F04CF63|nr:hypothetical protein [Pseudomonas simiae]WLG31865.1 hypothetical protein PSH82_15965 [Pseudomonas simiae]WLI21871.1 hypothetical protein PSH85_15995 [Pseudomonas simiae]
MQVQGLGFRQYRRVYDLEVNVAYEIKPFENGVLMALASLTYALKKSPGFDSSALDAAAKFFVDIPARGCSDGDDFDAYEWPLSVVQRSVADIEKLLENKGN